jgi:hypothetical protein
MKDEDAVFLCGKCGCSFLTLGGTTKCFKCGWILTRAFADSWLKTEINKT